MFSTHQLLLFFLAALTLNLIPGPDMLYILARTVSQDKQAGLISSLGISAGLVCHTLAAATGLSLLLLKSALLFELVKFSGAAYLIYLGGKMLFASQQSSQLSKEGSIFYWKIFKQGMLTNLLNPKIAIFFMAFLPQFVQANKPYVFLQLLILGGLFIVTGTLVNMSVAMLSAKFSQLALGSRFNKFQQKLTGLILIMLGLKVAS